MRRLVAIVFGGLIVLACTQKNDALEGIWQDSQGNRIQVTNSSFFFYRIVALPSWRGGRQAESSESEHSENEIIAHFMNACTGWIALSGQVLKCRKGWFSNAVSLVYLPTEQVLQVQIENVPVINSYHKIIESQTQ